MDEEQQDQPVPRGVFIGEDGSKYDGEYNVVDGLKIRDGQGVYTSGPERYEGQFKDDKFNGSGKYQFASGMFSKLNSSYKKYNLFILHYVGAVYIGDFLDGVFHGIGKYQFNDGGTYEGGWFENKMHGQGVYIDPNGQKFEGNFFNGCFNSGSSYISLRPT